MLLSIGCISKASFQPGGSVFIIKSTVFESRLILTSVKTPIELIGTPVKMIESVFTIGSIEPRGLDSIKNN